MELSTACFVGVWWPSITSTVLFVPTDPVSNPAVEMAWFADHNAQNVCHSSALARDVAVQAHDRVAQECAVTQNAEDDESVAVVQEAVLDALWSVARGWSDVHDDVAEVRELLRAVVAEAPGTEGAV